MRYEQFGEGEQHIKSFREIKKISSLDNGSFCETPFFEESNLGHTVNQP